jgi:hypothetical protein
MIGFWGHDYPDEGTPGPTIGFLQEAVRWYDRWLKGIENGIDTEPKLSVYLPDPPPGPGRQGEGRGFNWEIQGRWAAEPDWPTNNITTQTLYLNADALASQPAAEQQLQILSLTTAGAATSGPGPQPDQRLDDSAWLCFDSAPLDEQLEFFGNPYAQLTLAADKPVAHVAVRLCDIAPNGASTFISRGVLNLTHRESHEQPTPLEPGTLYAVRVRLDVNTRVLLPGHRLRLAVSPSYWPHIWPAPEPVTLTLQTGRQSTLELPIRHHRPEDSHLRTFDPPEASQPVPHETLYTRAAETDLFPYTLERDLTTGKTTVTHGRAEGWRFADGLTYSHKRRETYSVIEGQPHTARHQIEHLITLARGDWHTRVETTSILSTDGHAFLLSNTLEGFENGGRVFAHTWTQETPRDLV